ncbi:MAG: hypothetical protein ABWK05_05265, partial [Pyrobaculum sp.]
QPRKRSMLGLYFAVAIIVVILVVLVYLFVTRPDVVRGVVVAFLTVLIMFLPALYPRGVDVSHGVIIFKTYFITKVIRGYRVIAKFTTREFFDYVYMCPIGWRHSLWSLYGICSTAFGRATAISTPACSDLWLVVESQGKKYVVCCEEKDKEFCANA